MTKKKVNKPTAEEVISYFLWECGECKNIYTLDVDRCPNHLLDDMIVRGLIINDR